jgi:HlyD family secretion protein
MGIKARGRITEFTFFAALLLALGGLVSCSGAKNGRSILASGTIEAREVNVASRVSGQVLALKADEGSRVKKGDVLALIEHDTADIQLRQAEAGAALAGAQLDLVRKGARGEDIKQGEEALKQVDANLKVAGDDAKRMRELAAKGSVTLKQKDDAEARLIVAQAQQAQAREALLKLRRMSRPEEIRAAEARLAQAQASVDLLRKTISDCTITSPVNGVVTRRPVEAGELISPGATVLTVSELDSVHIMIYVTEKELGRVGLGLEAEVTIDSAPGRTFQGRVTYISPEAEFTPKNVQTREDRVKLVFGVKVEVPNPDGLLKPGMPADALLAATRTDRQ